jgi:hypothetical protein
MSGRLTRKTAPQEKYFSSQPPAGGDQHVRRPGQRGPDRPGGEDRHPGEERALAPEAVADAAAGQEQPGEDEDVGIDDPLQLAPGGREVAREGRQGHVEDRVVEHDHQQAETEDTEGPPAALIGLGGAD